MTIEETTDKELIARIVPHGTPEVGLWVGRFGFHVYVVSDGEPKAAFLFIERGETGEPEAHFTIIKPFMGFLLACRAFAQRIKERFGVTTLWSYVVDARTARLASKMGFVHAFDLQGKSFIYRFL